MRRAFALVELLVVVGVISLLMAILMPVLGRAREQATIVAVNAELYGIAMALESYGLDNSNRYPPTRADCNPWALEHAYALPEELVDESYLPGGQIGRIRYAQVEDKFNRGHTYKYIAVGAKYDFLGTPFGRQRLYVPAGFPSSEADNLLMYNDPIDSPVTWVLFSVGPRANQEMLETGNFPLTQGFPVAKWFWYSPEERCGILTRLRLKRGQHVGSFLE